MRLHRAGIALLSIALSAGLPIAAQNTASPFYGPIRNNDLAGLRRLVQKSGANTGDARHTTPLMYAAALGSLDAVKLLVEAGAGVNAANDFGATPLMWCAGDLAKVRYLLSKGAGVKVGRTPLGIAAAYDGSVEISRLLIEKGADVRAVDESGASVLEIAASVDNLEVARLLVAKGADVNTTDKDGYTPLGDAVSAGDRSAELVKLHRTLGVTTIYVTHDQTEAMTLGQRVTVLNHGVVQQVDAPQDLYDWPTNIFVADFIGSPPMNFVRGTIESGRVVIGGVGVPLPDGALRRLDTARRDVTVGLRPESFSRSSSDSGPVAGQSDVILGRVEIVERLGSESFVYFRADGLDVLALGDRPLELQGALCARLESGIGYEPGDRIELRVEGAVLRLFDHESGRAVLSA